MASERPESIVEQDAKELRIILDGLLPTDEDQVHPARVRLNAIEKTLKELLDRQWQQLHPAPDPRDRPLSDGFDEMQRARVFALDLAYGYNAREFPNKYAVQIIPGMNQNWYPIDRQQNFDSYLKRKWDNKPPVIEMLEQFGYFQHYDGDVYTLTGKALALLNDPQYREDK